MSASAPPLERPRVVRRPRILRARPAVRHWALPATLAAIVGGHVALRLALLWRFPPFFDEAGYGEWAQAVALDPARRFIALEEGKEPLTSWLGALIYHLGADYLTSVRLVSFAASLVTLAMIGLIARRISVPVALTAMGLYAVTPFFVIHDSLGLMEPTVTAAAMATLYLAIRLAERPSVDIALLLGIAMGAGVLTKESGRIAVAIVPLALLCFDWRRRDRRRRLGRWAAGVLLALVVCAAMFAILTLSPLWPTYLHGGDGLHRTLGDALKNPWPYFQHNFPAVRTAMLGYFGLPLVLAVLAGPFLAARRHRRLVALITAWGVVPFVAALFLANNGYPRYWMSAVAPLMIPAAIAVLAFYDLVVRRTRRARMGVLGGLIAVAVLAVAPGILLASTLANPDTTTYPALDDEQYRTDWPAGTAWKAAAQALERRMQGGSFVVGFDRARALSYYLDHPERAVQVPLIAPQSKDARFIVLGYDPTPPDVRRKFRLVGRFVRPGGKSSIRLFERK